MTHTRTWILALAITSSTALASEPGPSRFEGILVDKNASYIGDAVFLTIPNTEQAASAIPTKAAMAYRLRWDCALDRAGHPNDCSVTNVWPKNADVISLKKKLLPKIRLAPQNVAAVSKLNGRVYLDIFLDDPKRKLDSSCPPGWCPITPAPPSPQPKG